MRGVALGGGALQIAAFTALGGGAARLVGGSVALVRGGGRGGADREPASAVYEAVATARGQGVILWGGPANNKVK